MLCLIYIVYQARELSHSFHFHSVKENVINLLSLFLGIVLIVVTLKYKFSQKSIFAKIAPLEFIERDINTGYDKDCFNLIVNNISHTPISASQTRLFCSDEFIKKCEDRSKNEVTLNHYIS